MINLTELLKSYPAQLHGFQRFIIREYLQIKILEIIFESKFANKLCFLGGTCLRIIHNNSRFSEDIDFDNFNLSETQFTEIADIIKCDLEKEGFQVEIKNVFAGAFHCYIKFPNLLYNSGLSGHSDEKILIQLDTEAQHFDFTPEVRIVNKFGVFTSVLCTPKDILLAQKFFAILNRKRTKGRDFFDALFLLETTRPNYDYLHQKIAISNANELKSILLDKCKNTDMNEMAEDVKNFLFNQKDIKKIILFAEYIKQIDL